MPEVPKGQRMENPANPSLPSRRVELMAPAGSVEAMRAAIHAGADSVYFGAGHLQMRANATAFEPAKVPELVSICHEHGRKAYLTLNTVVYDAEQPHIDHLLEVAKDAGVDAVIASDFAVIEQAHLMGIPLHLSTQVNISNTRAATYFSRYAEACVLARELSLEAIEGIIKELRAQDIRGAGGEPLKIEVFAHGALCVAISGKCYMSLSQYGKSANRGECYQVCRRRYEVRDAETGFAYEVDNQFVMSPKDLCTLPVLDQIVGAGVDILKIEGRGRSADYVHAVVGSYRKALDAIGAGTFDRPFVEKEMQRLASVFNRGFWEGGYYLGSKLDPWARSAGSKSTRRKTYIGRVQNYFRKSGIVQIMIDAESFRIGEEILITGATTGVVETTPESMHVDDQPATEAGRGCTITFPLPEVVRPGDKVYSMTSNG